MLLGLTKEGFSPHRPGFECMIKSLSSASLFLYLFAELSAQAERSHISHDTKATGDFPNRIRVIPIVGFKSTIALVHYMHGRLKPSLRDGFP